MNIRIINHPKKIYVILFSLFILYSFWIYTIPLFNRKETSTKQTELISEGRMVWQKYNCHTCHQLYGLGGYLGPDLTNVYSKTSKNEAYIKGIIQSGVRQMPAFKISEEEINALLAFLKETDNSGTADIKKYKPEILGTYSLK